MLSMTRTVLAVVGSVIQSLMWIVFARTCTINAFCSSGRVWFVSKSRHWYGPWGIASYSGKSPNRPGNMDLVLAQPHAIVCWMNQAVLLFAINL